MMTTRVCLRRLLPPAERLMKNGGAINRPSRRWNTVPHVRPEALMWSLRTGTAALIEPDTRRRISELNDKQLAAVGTRLQRLQPHIAPSWSPASVARLAATWKAVRS